MTPVQLINKVVEWIKSVTPDSNDLLVPISGGTDSALCFYLCNKALPERTLGIYAGGQLKHQEWFESVGKLSYLTPTSSNKLNSVDWEAEIARWTYFVNIAIHENRILVGSRNRTEQHLGTFSMASRLAWYYPIAGIWKQDVINLCSHIGVPNDIIVSSSEADPACGRPEELAKIPLNLVDVFTKVKINELPESNLSQLSNVQIKYLEKIYNRNLFKQSLPQEGPLLGLG